MPNDAWRQHLPQFVITLRIIVFGLLSGMLAFAAVVLFMRLRPSGEGLNAELGLLTTMVLAFAAVALVAQAVVPNLMASFARRQIAGGAPPPAATGQLAEYLAATGDAGRLTFAYQTRTIIACAICEGVAFFALVTTMIEGSVLALTVAAVMAILVAARFPSQQRVADWVAAQERLLAEETALRR